MRISAICAMSENRVIGNNNKLPWHLPADLNRFKNITMGNPILMGRKTYESIGHPLPGRTNIILTHDVNYPAPGCIVVQSIEHALTAVKDHDELFIIGGATLYQEMLAHTQRIYLTLIHQPIEGDTFFPALDFSQWKEIERTDYAKNANNPYIYSFIVLERA